MGEKKKEKKPTGQTRVVNDRLEVDGKKLFQDKKVQRQMANLRKIRL